jgi:hypothetical protein
MAICAQQVVLLQFLAEAIFISVSGGIAGILIEAASQRLASADIVRRHCGRVLVLRSGWHLLRLIPPTQDGPAQAYRSAASIRLGAPGSGGFKGGRARRRAAR